LNNGDTKENGLRKELLVAIESKSEVSLTYKREGSAADARTVAPHALFRSGDGRLFLHAFQREGASSRGDLPDWRRFALESIANVDILSSTFSVNDGYDPASKAYSAGLVASVR
jgi:predicted DNA-binding transcriptional regulator YafY